MNKRQIAYWYNVYRTSLRYFGVELQDIKNPKIETLRKATDEWFKQTKDLDDFPTVREIYKQQVEYEKSQTDYSENLRDMNFRTKTADNMYDAALDVIQEFIDKVEQIYQDTMGEVDRALLMEEGVGKAAAIASQKPDAITKSKENLIQFINQMLQEVEGNPEPVAEAIKRNGELDYTFAIILVPPSDIRIAFDLEIENLQSIWGSIIKEARATAEQNME